MPSNNLTWSIAPLINFIFLLLLFRKTFCFCKVFDSKNSQHFNVKKKKKRKVKFIFHTYNYDKIKICSTLVPSMSIVDTWLHFQLRKCVIYFILRIYVFVFLFFHLHPNFGMLCVVYVYWIPNIHLSFLTRISDEYMMLLYIIYTAFYTW